MLALNPAGALPVWFSALWGSVGSCGSAPLSKAFVSAPQLHRSERRLAEGGLCVEQDAGGERGASGQDVAAAGGNPEERPTGGPVRRA